MSDKKDDAKDDAPGGFVSTDEGTKSSTPVGEDEPQGQTPDQFFDPVREAEKNAVDPPRNHATKGMTSLGYTEASRIEGTTAFQEAERKAFEKASAKESN